MNPIPASLRAERHRPAPTPSRYSDGRRIYSLARRVSAEGRLTHVVLAQGPTGEPTRYHDEAVPATNSLQEAARNLAAHAARRHWVEVR